MAERWFMILLILVIIVGGGSYAYHQLLPSPVKETQGPVYATKAVVRGDISVGVEASGPLNPSKGGGIQAPGGYGPMGPGAPGNTTYIIQEILVQPGDEVKAGQLIARLRAPDLEAQVQSLSEQIQADRQALSDLTGVPPSAVDRVDPAAGVTLRAPISGRVVGLTASEGAALKQGQIVAHVVDDSRFRLVAKATPVEFKQIKVGQRVALRFEQFDDFTPARVTAVNPSPIPESLSNLELGRGGGSASSDQYVFVYWVTIEGQNPGLIRPGMVAQVGLLPETAANGAEGSPIDSYSVTFLRYPAKVDGYVNEERVLNRADAIATRVYVQEMQLVKAGDPLVSLAGQDARDMIQKKLDKLREEETKLRQLQAQLGNLEVRVPMAGVVADINKTVGQTVMPGEWWGSIFNTDDMRLWVQVDDIDVLLVKAGAPVRVTVDAVPGKTFAGKVNRVNVMGQDQKGITRFAVDIEVKGSPELRPGMQAKAYIDAGSAKNVLLIPVEAIFEEDGKSKVEVLEPDGREKTVTVELGLMNDRVAEVKSGLNEGELVITGSSADLLPSQRIQGKDTLLPGQENRGNQKTGPSEEKPPVKGN